MPVIRQAKHLVCLCLVAALTGGSAPQPGGGGPGAAGPAQVAPAPGVAAGSRSAAPPVGTAKRTAKRTTPQLTLELPETATVAAGLVATLTLETPGRSAPTGRWAVKEGASVVARGRFRPADGVGGRAIVAVRLPSLETGAHRLTAVYAGGRGNRAVASPPAESEILLIGDETVDSFAELKITSTVGAAITPCAPEGELADHTVTLGEIKTTHAWSTAKVPSSIAALKQADTAANRGLARRAIRESDNAAFSIQLRNLGRWAGATAAIEADVLVPNGVTSEMTSTSAPPVGLGMWQWSLRDQAVFAAGIAARRDAETDYVLAQMGHIIAAHRWGLGTIPGAAFKGGWGLEARGELSRQFGIIRKPGGQCWAVALAAENRDGLAAANADLTAMAKWFSRHRTEFESGTAKRLPG
ncbi:MAG: hypothetical protein LBT54_02805 [Bifidobacteriaceae bacterium]|jgi:hypothetical protein|nr:hypothetical protein [Bifidobacteriaceae bacterium]